jgi:hypothetical protein
MVGPACTNSGAVTGDGGRAPVRNHQALAARVRGGDAVRMPRSPLAAPFALALGTLLALTSLVLTPESAAACSCAWFDAPTARDQATHVFEGVLVNAIPASDAAPGRAVFRVDRVWKGRVSRTFTVQATIGLTMCPPHLEVGQRYILYTAGSNAAPRVEACSRFAAGESLETERRALGTPTQTYPTTAL